MKPGRNTIPDLGKEYEGQEPVIRLKDSQFGLSRDSAPPDEEEGPDESGLFDAVRDADIESPDAIRQQIDETQREELEELKKIVKIMLSAAEELTDDEVEWSLEHGITINGISKARELAEIEKGRLRRALKLLHKNCTKIRDILDNPSGVVNFIAKGYKLKIDLGKVEFLLEDILGQLDPKDASEIKPARRKWRKLPDKEVLMETQSASGFSPLAVQRFRQIIRYLQRELQEAQLKHGVYTIRVDTIGEFVRRRLDQIKEFQRSKEFTPDQVRLSISQKIKKSLPDL